jgi:hypothetical protein
MVAQIDAGDRGAGTVDHARGEIARLAAQCEHGAMVIRVRVDVEQT